MDSKEGKNNCKVGINEYDLCRGNKQASVYVVWSTLSFNYKLQCIISFMLTLTYRTHMGERVTHHWTVLLMSSCMVNVTWTHMVYILHSHGYQTILNNPKQYPTIGTWIQTYVITKSHTWSVCFHATNSLLINITCKFSLAILLDFSLFLNTDNLGLINTAFPTHYFICSGVPQNQHHPPKINIYRSSLYLITYIHFFFFIRPWEGLLWSISLISSQSLTLTQREIFSAIMFLP